MWSLETLAAINLAAAQGKLAYEAAGIVTQTPANPSNTCDCRRCRPDLADKYTGKKFRTDEETGVS